MAVTHDGFEYARYGDGYVFRKEGSKDGWGAVVGELPEPVADQFAVKRLAKAGQVTRQRPRTEGQFSGGVSGGAIIKPNKAVEEAAEKLGLTAQEFRQRLTDDSTDGTRARVSDAEFDRIMKPFMSPQEARDRFAGRFTG